LIIHVDLLDKLRTLRVHAELRRHFGRVRKRNVRSEWFIIARGCIEQLRRARDRLSAHFRGHAHASGDEHVAAKSDNRGAGKTRIGHFQWHSLATSKRFRRICRCSFDLLSISLFTMQTFEFVTNEDGSVAYLYSLTSGHVARSFAHAAARSAGLDEKIVKRALEVIADFAWRMFKPFTCENHVNSIILIDIVRILKIKTFVDIRKI